MLMYEKRLKTALSEISRRLKLKKFRFEYSGIDENFENYVGVMVPITLIEENSDGEVCSRLLAKMPPNKKVLRDIGLLEYAYMAESFFYMALLPCYKGFSRIDLSAIFAECYYADAKRLEEVIVLEDMRARGFRRYQGNRFLDFDHVVVCLHSLALLHALSMIFQNKKVNIQHTTHLNPYFLKFPPGLLEFSKDCINNYVGLFRGTKHGAFFNKLAANFDNVVNDCVHNAKHLIYGHGDFWKKNIIFKYEDNKPVKACVVDFQTIRLLSPAQDVLSFLLTSTKAASRRNYYDFFIEMYHNRLRNILIDYSLDPNVIYSKNDFICDLKTVSSYCFLTTNMSFSLWSGLKKDGLLKNKIDKDEDSEAIASYKKTMLDIADDFITFGYYSPQ